MKKPKIKKYIIESALADSILSCPVEVSAEKFKKAMKDLDLKIANQDAADGDEFYINTHVRVYDKNTYVENQKEYTWGCSSIYLIELTCKEGYYFTK